MHQLILGDALLQSCHYLRRHCPAQLSPRTVCSCKGSQGSLGTEEKISSSSSGTGITGVSISSSSTATTSIAIGTTLHNLHRSLKVSLPFWGAGRSRRVLGRVLHGIRTSVDGDGHISGKRQVKLAVQHSEVDSCPPVLLQPFSCKGFRPQVTGKFGRGRRVTGERAHLSIELNSDTALIGALGHCTNSLSRLYLQMPLLVRRTRGADNCALHLLHNTPKLVLATSILGQQNRVPL